jgi:hypothetical protein
MNSFTHREHVSDSTIYAAVALAQQGMHESGIAEADADAFSDIIGDILCGEGVYLSTKDLAALVAQWV